MAAIPNLNTLRGGRRRPRLRGGGRTANNEEDIETGRDQVVQQTDQDASSSRMSAVQLGYLEDVFARQFWPPNQEVPKRYPIINRGTFVRTKAIDKLAISFLASVPQQRKQIVSLGAGSDTRFFRFWAEGVFAIPGVEYHELDFESNVNQKRNVIRSSSSLSSLIAAAEKANTMYRLHAIDLRTLTAKSPPLIPSLDPELPTLLISECCLCYLPPDTAGSVLQYFMMHIKTSRALVVYEPIRPFDAFGKTMVSNLASRGIDLQTLKRYPTLQAQRQRMRVAGFDSGQGARDVHELWDNDDWMPSDERQRVEHLEWLDEVEEWQLLASHYCVAWGWSGEAFEDAWRTFSGMTTATEAAHDRLEES